MSEWNIARVAAPHLLAPPSRLQAREQILGHLLAEIVRLERGQILGSETRSERPSKFSI
jgi:hypothetical protein